MDERRNRGVRQVCCVVAMAIPSHNTCTSAFRHYRLARIVKPRLLLGASSFVIQIAATCDPPSREFVLPSECAVVVGCSGCFWRLFPRHRGHRCSRFAPYLVRPGGVGDSAPSRCTPKGRVTNRAREVFCSACMVWVRQWLLPLMLQPNFHLGPPGTARAARLYLGVMLQGI